MSIRTEDESLSLSKVRINLSNQSVDFLALNETRLDCSLEDPHFVINGYDLIRNDRNRQRGGIAIYFRKIINYHIRRDFDLEGIEGICIKIIGNPVVNLLLYLLVIDLPILIDHC